MARVQQIGGSPHDEGAERSILGAMLTSDKAVSTALSELTDTDFYGQTHRIVFNAIRAAAAHNGPVDQITVSDQLRHEGEYEKAGGRRFVFELIEGVPTTAGLSEWIRIVRRHALTRSGIDVSLAMKHALEQSGADPEEVLSSYRGRLDETIRRDDTRHVGTLEGSHREMVEYINRLVEGGGLIGIPFGIQEVDNFLEGAQGGRTYVVGGPTGVGKTIFAGEVALNAGYAGYRSLWQSIEMGKRDVLTRCAFAHAELDWTMRAHMSEEEQERLATAGIEVGQLPIIVDDAGKQTVERIRQNVIRYQPDILIVDHIHKVTSSHPNKNRHEQLGEISRELEELARDFDIPVVILAQLSRGVKYMEDDERPDLHHLRESGNIEEDAHVVMFLWRERMRDEDAPPDEIEFICRKNRHGSTFETTAYLNPKKPWIENRRQRV